MAESGISESIGIRELRQHASRYVDKCAEGESFVVTDRGRAVGVLAGGWEVIRMHASQLVDALVASGHYATREQALTVAVEDLVREMERSAVDAAIVEGYRRQPAANTPDEWGDLGPQLDIAAANAWDELDSW